MDMVNTKCPRTFYKHLVSLTSYTVSVASVYADGRRHMLFVAAGSLDENN